MANLPTAPVVGPDPLLNNPVTNAPQSQRITPATVATAETGNAQGVPYVDPTVAAMNAAESQASQQASAYDALVQQANNAQLGATFAGQAADYQDQAQQAQSALQNELSQIPGTLANLQSSNALSNAQAQQNAVFSGAKDLNTAAARGMGDSGIALGVAGRDATALQQTLSTQNLNSQQQQYDALSKANADSVSAAQNIAGFNNRAATLTQAAQAAGGGSV